MYGDECLGCHRDWVGTTVRCEHCGVVLSCERRECVEVEHGPDDCIGWPEDGEVRMVLITCEETGQETEIPASLILQMARHNKAGYERAQDHATELYGDPGEEAKACAYAAHLRDMGGGRKMYEASCKVLGAEPMPEEEL